MTHNLPLNFTQLVILSTILAFFILILRSVLKTLLFHPIASKLALKYHSEKWRDINKDKVDKFADSGFKLLVHTAMTYWGFR
jgi:hypothetical protein